MKGLTLSNLYILCGLEIRKLNNLNQKFEIVKAEECFFHKLLIIIYNNFRFSA